MDIDAELARVAMQEDRLKFERFDASVAWSLGVLLRQAAIDRHAGIAIDISTHAQPLFYHATEWAVPDNAEWVRRKRNLTFRFFRSSYAIGLELKRDGRTLRARNMVFATLISWRTAAAFRFVLPARHASARSPFPACRNATTMTS